MKSLKKTILILVLMSTVVGLAQKKYTEESVKSALKQGFVAFVDNVRPAYTRGDTYNEFKKKVFFGDVVLPNYTLPPVPTEGENLLSKSYQLLVANYTSKEMLDNVDYKTFGKAVLFINDYSKDQNKSVLDAEIALFGNNGQLLNNNSLLNSTRGKCKWWQLWCHLNQIFGNGGGAQILQAIIVLIITIL